MYINITLYFLKLYIQQKVSYSQIFYFLKEYKLSFQRQVKAKIQQSFDHINNLEALEINA